MKFITRWRLALARWIAPPLPDLEGRTQVLYEEIWPKHEFYKERTLKSIRQALGDTAL